MIPVETAVRAWVEPAKVAPRRAFRAVAWRSAAFGERVLVFDTETTTDWTQRLLYGFFRHYVGGELQQEGIFVADDLSEADLEVAQRYSRKHGIPVYTREHFVDEIFYPEVYELGALCVGYNLPFDLTRIAVAAGPARRANGRKFSVQLSRRVRWPRLHIESASARASFIQFTWKKHLASWEKPFFKGRFLDLSTLTGAFTGEALKLEKACAKFGTQDCKSSTKDLGKVTEDALHYGRHDVLVTWQLYERLVEEYLRHPFASLANERELPPNAIPITRIYSAASVAKAYLKTMGVRPLLEKQPRFPRRLLGYAAAAYFGGRSEVRVRRVQVAVTVLDFTSMYPTVFLLQELQQLLGARRLRWRDATSHARKLLATASLEDLYRRDLWPQLKMLVRVRPAGHILPVRMRTEGSAPFTISVTPFHSEQSCWYTMADVLAAKVLGAAAPDLEEAIEFYATEPDDGMEPVKLRGSIELDPHRSMFKTIVEQRQIAKKAAKSDMEAGRLEMALKIMANSGAYGIFAEVNVMASKAQAGTVYSDMEFSCASVHDERPGKFCNPIVASLVTGAARLLLAMLEAEVACRGGTFAFCDTDSLAIVSGPSDDPSIPWLSAEDIASAITGFESLNPYDPAIVPHLLKREHEDVLCWPISAKRYCLYRIDANGATTIIKASESGLGAILGRDAKEGTKQLAEAVWSHILDAEVGQRHGSRHGHLPFDIPLRRKLPLSQPHVLNRDAIRRYNASRSYSHRLKPFNFVQVLTPSLNVGLHEVLPIAPFERDLRKARKLPWMDVHSGRPIAIDWASNGHAGTVGIATLAEYVARYAVHPENKAADGDGRPAGMEHRGLLYRARLRATRRSRIGKEVDRLEEDSGTALDGQAVVTYDVGDGRDLSIAIAALRSRSAREVAHELGVSERRWRDILKGRARPRQRLGERIGQIAVSYRAAQLPAAPDSNRDVRLVERGGGEGLFAIAERERK